MKPSRIVAGSFFVLLALLTSVASPLCAQETWRVKEATIRFTVTLLRTPTHPSAGYFLRLPDGGILPAPYPVTQVVDAQGNTLKSYSLWQNRESGLGVVFEAPKVGKVAFIYVASGTRLNTWTPDSGLTPSAIIATHPGHGAKNDAANLSRLGAVDATVHYRNEPGSQNAPLALPGDRSGRPGYAAMYMLAHVATTEPGETWIAPVSFGGGVMQVSVDGTQLALHKVNDKQGGTGANVTLSAGLHRLDLLGFYPVKNGGPEIILTWRTPKTSSKELGGIRPSDLRYAGTPMWEARQLHPREIVRSGECVIQRLQSRDGGPVAHFTLEPHQVYWFGNETPLVIYRLNAFQAGNPDGTQYSWSFSNSPGAAPTGAGLQWLFPSLRDQRVTLRAVAGGRQSQCTAPFYPFSETHTSLNDPAARLAFRSTCLGMLQSYPPTKDPTEGWDISFWNNFFRNIELTRQTELVSHLVTNRWDAISKKLAPEQKEMLEDIFFATTAANDPQTALKWALLLEQKTTEQTAAIINPSQRLDLARQQDARTHKRDRAVMLRLKGAEVLMYQLKNLDEARKWVRPLTAETGEAGEWARIRMGDIEFLSRNLNEATQLYGDVQDRCKHTKTPAEIAAAAKAEAAAEELHKGKKRGKGTKEPVRVPPPPTRVAPWKLSAIRDVAAAENVRNLLEQGYNWEAWQALRAWEREFPLSKISSDYLLAEGKLCMALGDYARCRALLEAYCDQVDASNYVGEAMELIVQCMTFMREPPEAIAKYRAAIKKRMEFH